MKKTESQYAAEFAQLAGACGAQFVLTVAALVKLKNGDGAGFALFVGAAFAMRAAYPARPDDAPPR